MQDRPRRDRYAPFGDTRATSSAAGTGSLRRTLRDRERDTRCASPPTASAANIATRPQNTTVAKTSDERLLSGLIVVMVFGRVAPEAIEGLVGVDVPAGVADAL